MPVIGANTLVEFEIKRSELKYFPRSLDDSHIGPEAIVRLVPVRLLPNNERYDIVITNRHVEIGDGEFLVTGDLNDNTKIYRNMIVEDVATLDVNGTLTVDNEGKLHVPGAMVIRDNGTLNVHGGGRITFPRDSVLTIESGAILNVDFGVISIEGMLFIAADMLETVKSLAGVIISNLARVHILELPRARLFSLTDFITEIHSEPRPLGWSMSRYIGLNASSLYTIPKSSKDLKAHAANILIRDGKAIVGDFNVLITGEPNELNQNERKVSQITIGKDSTLVLADHFLGCDYHSPSIILTRLDDRELCYPPKLEVHGKLIIEGEGHHLQYGEGSEVTIYETGELYLNNGATLHLGDRTGKLIVDGKIYVDTLDQLSFPDPENFIFGPSARIVVRNEYAMDDGERLVLLELPDGVRDSELYRLFGDRLHQVEFHLPINCGVKVDRTMKRYDTLRDWYGGYRIEEVIEKGWLVWHDGAFIELDKEIVPWVDVANPSLKEATKIFKSLTSDDQSRVQDIVTRFRAAGGGDVVFRFVDGNNSAETVMPMGNCHMRHVSYDSVLDGYELITSDEGNLFIVQKLTDGNLDALNIINHKRSKQVDIIDSDRVTFQLP